MTRAQAAGAVLLVLIVGSALAAPVLTPHAPDRQFADRQNAPPMPIRLVTLEGRVVAPFVYPLQLIDRLERRYLEDRTRPVPVRWLTGGSLASIDESHGPWLPLGGDPLGRDLFARLLYGARLSLGLAAVATVGALVTGMLIGAPAGFVGGRLDTLLMGVTDLVLILPALFVVLSLRAALPLVLSVPQVFWSLALVLTAAGWPVAARGVRAIVAAERHKEYAEAAYSTGAGPLRILLRHLLPATTGFLALTAAMMVPAFILAEATVTMVGLGFAVPAASWGAMMRDAWEGGALAEAPWLLAPAAAVVLTVLALHLLATGRAAAGDHPGTFS